MRYYLAIDIGASSGRHILGHIENGKLCLREIYRFENYIINVNGTLAWDIEHLVSSVIEGIKKCNEINIVPDTVAIDTWGVDYVLLDADQKEILPAVSYRDSRTNGIPEEIDRIISRQGLYARNGIQPINFNTIYQLYCDKKSGKLDQAAHFLMMPSYLAFKLTGKLENEYTNATTGALINAQTKKLDTELLEMLGIKTTIFSAFSMPSTKLGGFSEEIKAQIGFDSTVVLAASHDTASAVAACPIRDNGMYISSGTWSLIGTEILSPVLTPQALGAGFTNEGGVDYRYRFLKNFMGMWLFQNIRKNLDKKYTYDEMMRMAMDSPLLGYIDPNAKEFVAPENMIEAIKAHLGMPEMTLGEVLASVYHSLARSYKEAVETIERISGQEVELINIMGGGSKDSYLNTLTAEYTKKRVIAGPVEATAIGNLITQMMYDNKELTLADARDIVKNSFDDIKEVSI